MRRRTSWPLCLTISFVLLAGCAGGGTFKYEPINEFGTMDASRAPDVELVDVEPKPKAVPLNVDGTAYAGYDAKGVGELRAHLESLKANRRQAEQLALVLKHSELERQALINAGRAAERHANYLGRRLEETQAELAEERNRHFLTRWVGRIVSLVLLGFAVQ